MEKKTARVSLKLTPALYTQIETEARRKDRSINWLITKYIQIGLKGRHHSATRKIDAP